MIRILLSILVLGLITACAPQKDGKPYMTREICIKGVIYYVGRYHLAPAFKQDGTLYTCHTPEQ